MGKYAKVIGSHVNGFIVIVCTEHRKDKKRDLVNSWRLLQSFISLTILSTIHTLQTHVPVKWTTPACESRRVCPAMCAAHKCIIRQYHTYLCYQVMHTTYTCKVNNNSMKTQGQPHTRIPEGASTQQAMCISINVSAHILKTTKREKG